MHGEPQLTRPCRGQEISEPFHNLPTRKLTDYYALIKKPVSLKAIQKLVRGKHGRQEASGVSDFKSWKAYEEEFSYIWRNAWEYNEDGSDISLLATQLQVRRGPGKLTAHRILMACSATSPSAWLRPGSLCRNRLSQVTMEVAPSG